MEAINENSIDRLLSLDDVAAILSVCTRSVRRLVESQELPPFVKIGRSSRLYQSDIEAYLEKLKEKRM